MDYALDAICRINMIKEALDAMISLVRSQEDLLPVFGHVGSIEFLKHHCSVRVSGPRRSGHTTSIAHMVDNHFSNSLVITPHKIAVGKTIKGILNKNGLSNKCSVDTLQNVLKNSSQKYLGTIFDAIIIDGASYMSEEETSQLYDFAANFAEYKRARQEIFIMVFLQ